MDLDGAGVKPQGTGDHLLMQPDLQGLEDNEAEEPEGDGRNGEQRAPGIAADITQTDAGIKGQGLHRSTSGF